MPSKINIYFDGKVVATIFNKWKNGCIESRIKCYEGFSEYCRKERIESIGKVNYSEWGY